LTGGYQKDRRPLHQVIGGSDHNQISDLKLGGGENGGKREKKGTGYSPGKKRDLDLIQEGTLKRCQKEKKGGGDVPLRSHQTTGGNGKSCLFVG